jgi:cyclopropane-fatty-acyl-phospholipid synthase
VSSRDAALRGPAIGESGAKASALWRRLLQRYLQGLSAGTLTVTLPSGAVLRHQGGEPGPDAVLNVCRWRAVRRMLTGGDLGFARAYIDDDWRSPDLVALLDFATVNETALGEAASGSLLARGLDRLRHLRRSNTRRGSRRNIAAHYDLGNDFYAFWLDAGMNYSSALFSDADQTLEQAQIAKLQRVAELLNVRSGHNVLEIGIGWGALAEYLTTECGCSVTGLTLSNEQLAYAQTRLHATARANTWDLRLQDYRDVRGRYDRIASIEMVEAVGEHYWPLYFAKLRHLLTGDGIAVLQAITIADERFAAYRRRPDFIQRYIFPGGMLPSVEIIRREAERAGLCTAVCEVFGGSYARTLAEWRRRFLQAWPKIAALGFDARFQRMWDYYLAYCEIGFRSGAIDVHLLRLTPA